LVDDVNTAEIVDIYIVNKVQESVRIGKEAAVALEEHFEKLTAFKAELKSIRIKLLA
jgi:hypothetical protein